MAKYYTKPFPNTTSGTYNHIKPSRKGWKGKSKVQHSSVRVVQLHLKKKI